MNIENAKTLVGQLKRLPDEKFWMFDLMKHGECGTSACIAGWASILNGGPTELTEETRRAIWNFAQGWLGLASGDAYRLFEGEWSSRDDLRDITRSEAIAELESMIVEAGP